MKRQIISRDELEKDFDEEVKKDILQMICGGLIIIFQFALAVFGTVELIDWFSRYV